MTPADLGPAPDFQTLDLEGKPIRLSDYRGRSHILFVLIRGFS